jgi:hypothetical protein
VVVVASALEIRIREARSDRRDEFATDDAKHLDGRCTYDHIFDITVALLTVAPHGADAFCLPSRFSKLIDQGCVRIQGGAAEHE